MPTSSTSPVTPRLAERFTVHGYDPAPDRSALAAESGVTPAVTARDAARGADAVLLAVRNREQLQEALYGDAGVADVLPRAGLVILTSTVGTDAVREFAARLLEDGFQLVDAPISGGPGRAATGELLITVGATDAAFAAAEPILQQLSSTLQRMGPNPGDGRP